MQRHNSLFFLKPTPSPSLVLDQMLSPNQQKRGLVSYPLECNSAFIQDNDDSRHFA